MSSINSLYDLTAMTGRSSGSERTTVIGTVEMRWRTLWISVIGFVPALVMFLATMAFLNVWALLWFPLTIAAAFYLLERRTSEGLQLRTYQSLFDRKRSSVNEFYLCGQPIDVAGAGFGSIRTVTGSLPARPDRPETLEEYEEARTA
ncbi:hypothetical protein V6N00_12940 [Tersicoccus sp. MR15.9]|uniref:hypothetical protein n=1 Tax=Tersicoccus mangrovi TaxID=3121635 RepID=UPI002FE624BD